MKPVCRAWTAGAAAATVWALLAMPVCAQTAKSLVQPPPAQRVTPPGGSGFFSAGAPDRTPAPPIARYVTEGRTGFTFDRSTSQPMIRFEGSAEIWVLRAEAAPRGGVVYKNDVGETMVRQWGGGGLTVYTSDHAEGLAVRPRGTSTPLVAAPVTNFEAYDRRILEASFRIRTAVGHGVFVGSGPTRKVADAPILADAAMVTAEAIERIMDQDGRTLALRRVVLIVVETNPGASLRDEQLTVTVNPDQGLAGRPSSRKIEQALAAAIK